MTVELDRKDIISLLRGTTPPYSVMNKIPKELGSYIGGFVDSWHWNYIDENISYTDYKHGGIENLKQKIRDIGFS